MVRIIVLMPVTVSTLESALRSTVVGVDLVRRRDDVTDRASRLRLGTGVRVTLLHVLSHDAGRAAEDESSTRLRALAATVLARRPDAVLDVAVRRGDPVAQLARFVEENRPELLVVGRGRTAGLFPSTIAERLASRSDVPVLAVGTGRRSPYRRFLVAIESPGEASSWPIENARRLLDGAACDSHVVFAVDHAIERRMQQAGAPRHAILMARRWLRSRLRAQISSWLGGTVGADEIRVWLEAGDPSAAILDVARRTMPDLLVVGADRRWLRRGLLRPSVGGVVLRRADCDVLIVRGGRPRAVAVRSATAAA